VSPRALRLGLRGRVTAAFAVGALILSALLALLTWTVARSYLLAQRQAITVETALEGARLLSTVPVADNEVPAALAQVGGASSSGLLYRSGQWFAEGLTVTPEQLPPVFVEGVLDGVGQLQRVELAGKPALAVAVPLGRGQGTYVEIFPISALDRALQTLSYILVGSATVTTGLGVALGRWASGRALRPLERLSDAAAAVAQGDLSVRLDARDDDGLRELTASFNANTAALAERVARDERFASDVSHELRSPLTTIANAVELLLARRGTLSATGQEAVDLLSIEVRRLQQLVVDLLEVSRDPDDGRLEELDLVRVADVVQQVADRTAGHPVTEVEPSARDALVRGDARRLERVVRNLVVNAESHGRGLAAVHVSAPAGRVVVTVDDRGPGVPEPWRERVFERFTRGPGAASAEDEPGAGLGLSLVQRQVALHHGRVRVEDGPTGGRFVVELPQATE
jgi:two-component system sensor histidine kinase MtrB